jgi:hypothetical protein
VIYKVTHKFTFFCFYVYYICYATHIYTMTKTSKMLFTCIIALAIGFHFMWISVYCFPQHGNNTKIGILSRLYVYPIFQQNWALFVPAPDTERKLFVRYKTENTFNRWEDILGREISIHKQNRLLGNESKVLLLSNSLIYELNSLNDEQSFISNKKNNSEFKVLQFEVEHYLKSEYHTNLQTEYELLMVSLKKGGERAYYIQNLSFH